MGISDLGGPPRRGHGLRLCVLRAIYKAVMQNAEKRYRDGEEMTRALRVSAMRISGLAA